MVPSHYLNQWWNIVNWTVGNKCQRNLNQNLYIFSQENAFENVVCEMAAIFFLSLIVLTRPKWFMIDICVTIVSIGLGKKDFDTIANEVTSLSLHWPTGIYKIDPFVGHLFDWCWISLGLLSRCHILKSRNCKLFENQLATDFIYGYPFIKWVAVTWLYDRAPR